MAFLRKEMSRERFCSELVTDYRIVNWSPYFCSVISDIEVQLRYVEQPTEITVPGRIEPVFFGRMYFIKYPLENPTAEDEFVIVATTRPETIPADQAIAVHPEDPRYGHLIGLRVRNPLLPGKLLLLYTTASIG
ncbi:conserved hypothetical protein [Trichinella spiralis]|uniref:hypothetical protein n=1 Tax=Trichinella spiralis TaxID=6334 RepID=UPI0001EFE990|nr:conserved hypothetical protein [Trichinella spiralis]